MKDNSLDLSEPGDDIEFPLTNSTLGTEVAAPDKIVLCSVCPFDSSFFPVSPQCPYEAEYVAKQEAAKKKYILRYFIHSIPK